MKPIVIFPLIVLLASPCANSQHAGTAEFSTTRSTAPTDCPVGLDVRHGSLSEKRLVQDPAPRAGGEHGMALPEAEQRILLSLTNLQQQPMESARITIRGLSRKGRLAPAGADVPGVDLARSIEIAAAIAGNGSTVCSIALRHFAVVTKIELTQVTYSDGSTWRAAAQGVCSATPNLLMLADVAR